jgi:hypothetical protein
MVGWLTCRADRIILDFSTTGSIYNSSSLSISFHRIEMNMEQQNKKKDNLLPQRCKMIVRATTMINDNPPNKKQKGRSAILSRTQPIKPI